MKVTFDSLPEAVSELYNKLNNIETLLSQQGTAQPAPEQDELLTVKGAAEFLSLSVPTVYGLISKNQLPVMKRSKRCYFSKAELINYLKEGRKPTQAEIEKEAPNYLRKKPR